jgi:hypothetical protein
MKNNSIIMIFLSWIFILIPLSIISQTTIELEFDKPVRTDFNDYVIYNYNNTINTNMVGYPYLPVYIIPRVNTIETVYIDSITFYTTESDILIYPKQEEYIDFRFYLGFTPPNDSIYNTDVYPLDILNHDDNNIMLYPVIYYPRNKQVKFIKYIKLTINDKKESIFLKRSYIEEEYDILIITKNEFVNDFLRYTNFKQQHGYYSKVISIEDIYNQYQGRDRQEKIRNSIRYYYNNHNTRYVILGGTSLPTLPNRDIIPHRGMWGYFIVPENDIPADIYYSNLDGEWINDGDTVYGKIGSEDLTSEVILGRLPVIDKKNVNDIIDKLILYQDQPVTSDILKNSLVGEQLMTGIYGSREMEDLFNYGLPVHYSYYRIYDTLNETRVSTDNVLKLYNNIGINIINHIGHSSQQNNMKLSTGYYINRYNLRFIFNDGINYQYPIIYSQGCYSGALDLRDGSGIYHAVDPNELHCVAGAAVVGTNGAVAFINNSRYGFYGIGSWGTSQLYHREFIRSLFEKNITRIGDAFYDSKNVFAPLILQPNSNTYLRWLYYTLNLFGDPTMEIWTDIPTNLTVNYPRVISKDTHTIDFKINDTNSMVACIVNNVLVGRGQTNTNGDVTITLKKKLNVSDKIFVYVTAPNKNKYRGTIDVINEVKGNISGVIKYKNVQNTPMENVVVKLYKDNTIYSQVISDKNGEYIFYNVDNGNYIIKVESSLPVGNINSSDALHVQKYFVGLITLDSLNLLSADVTNDGYVNSYDAYVIQKYFVDDPVTFPTNIGKWIFEKKNINVNNNSVNIDIMGLCYGDVNGNYVPVK